MVNVLYVDDERHNLTAFKAAFRRDFNVFIADSADEGIRIFAAESHSCYFKRPADAEDDWHRIF